MIESDDEWRHCESSGCFTGECNYALRRACAVAEIEQREVEQLLRSRLALQSVIGSQTLCKLINDRGGICIGVDAKEQSDRGFGDSIEPHERELLRFAHCALPLLLS